MQFHLQTSPQEFAATTYIGEIVNVRNRLGESELPGVVREVAPHGKGRRREDPCPSRLLDLPAEDVGDCLVVQVVRAAFAWAAIFEKAPGSFTAMSARTLRSSSIAAFFRPFMNAL